MMSSNNLFCCGKCFHTIASQSTKAAKMWLDLCKAFTLQRGVFSVSDYNSEVLAILEKEGYITTTEDHKLHIAIRVNGYNLVYGDEELFCINMEDHCDQELL